MKGARSPPSVDLPHRAETPPRSSVDPRPASEAFTCPVTLTGRFVILRPLSAADVPALARAGAHDEIWTHLMSGPGRTEEEMRRLVTELLEQAARRETLPFSVQRAPDGPLIGMTRFLNIERANRAVEIGGTWYDPAYWGTGVNPESKWLLLRHAFESEGAHRVQLIADVRNHRSQRAIERLGAQREGVLRDHRVRRDGTYRSSVYYSILANEWPRVRAALERRLEGLSPPAHGARPDSRP